MEEKVDTKNSGNKSKNPARRKFIKGGALAVAGGAALVALSACEEKPKKEAKKKVEAPAVTKAAPVVLKVQAAWGGGIFLEDAKNYVKRVNDMAGSGLRIDLLSVNSVVKTSQ
ncbi:MAG: hypothetical protein V3R66_02630, partial [Rhodospirillales bacterium]